MVARRKGNYASSQSTAITGQRDETDGAVPGPQSSGKVSADSVLDMKPFNFYVQVSHTRSKSAPAAHPKGSESDTDGRKDHLLNMVTEYMSYPSLYIFQFLIHVCVHFHVQVYFLFQVLLYLKPVTTGNEEVRGNYSGTESQGEDEVVQLRIS